MPKLTATQVSQVFSGIASIAHALEDGGVQNFKATVSQLVEQLKPVLPENADGTPFSDDQIHEAAIEARKPFQNVIDRG
jgi:hypothetical protein